MVSQLCNSWQLLCNSSVCILQVPGARLALVGDGPQRQELEQMFKDMPVKFMVSSCAMNMNVHSFTLTHVLLMVPALARTHTWNSLHGMAVSFGACVWDVCRRPKMASLANG